MIKPDMIPDEVVKAAVNAWKKDTQSFRPNAETIAAALNAWPGGQESGMTYGKIKTHIYILPLPQEARDE